VNHGNHRAAAAAGSSTSAATTTVYRGGGGGKQFGKSLRPQDDDEDDDDDDDDEDDDEEEETGTLRPATALQQQQYAVRGSGKQLAAGAGKYLRPYVVFFGVLVIAHTRARFAAIFYLLTMHTHLVLFFSPLRFHWNCCLSPLHASQFVISLTQSVALTTTRKKVTTTWPRLLKW
jgi:hypothetical protein